jgi:hypothetical protein
MSWISLAITLLKIVSNIMTYARERELISQGQDEVIAEVTRSIFEKTTAGKAIMERVNGLSDEEVDADLRGLEPE